MVLMNLDKSLQQASKIIPGEKKDPVRGLAMA